VLSADFTVADDSDPLRVEKKLHVGQSGFMELVVASHPLIASCCSFSLSVQGPEKAPCSELVLLLIGSDELCDIVGCCATFPLLAPNVLERTLDRSGRNIS
jgi:hypothetical protein